MPAIAVAFIDVVMETDTAGLDICQALRERHGNPSLNCLSARASLASRRRRTVIDRYDINGYFTKVEATEDKLYSLVKSGVRQYLWNVVALETSQILNNALAAGDSRAGAIEAAKKAFQGIHSLGDAPVESRAIHAGLLIGNEVVGLRGLTAEQVLALRQRLDSIEAKQLGPDGDAYAREGNNLLIKVQMGHAAGGHGIPGADHICSAGVHRRPLSPCPARSGHAPRAGRVMRFRWAVRLQVRKRRTFGAKLYPRENGFMMNYDTLIALLRERAGSALPVGYRYLEKGEVSGPVVEWSWAELDRRARAIGATLQELGYEGERALLLFPPGLDFIAAFFGSLYAGTVAVPAYPPDPARLPRLQGIVRDARPAVVLTTASVRQQMASLGDRVPEIAVLETIAVDRCASGQEDAWKFPRAGESTLAFLQYTSGSTGLPRGVRITHEQALANQRMIVKPFGIHEAELVSWLPLFHDMGLIGTVIQPLYQDRPATLMSPLSFVKRPMRWLRAISARRAPISGGPDFGYALCVRTVRPGDFEGLDLSCWKLAFSGAEPVRRDTLDSFAKTFAAAGFNPSAFYPTYGLAEATLFVTGGQPGQGANALSLEGRDVVDCGPAAPETEIAILHADGTVCMPDEIGEIAVRSPSVSDGYWDSPAESAETFKFKSSDGREWLRTGDLGLLRQGQSLCHRPQ